MEGKLEGRVRIRENIVLSLARFRDMHIGSSIGEMEV